MREDCVWWGWGAEDEVQSDCAGVEEPHFDCSAV